MADVNLHYQQGCAHGDNPVYLYIFTFSSGRVSGVTLYSSSFTIACLSLCYKKDSSYRVGSCPTVPPGPSGRPPSNQLSHLHRGGNPSLLHTPSALFSLSQRHTMSTHSRLASLLLSLISIISPDLSSPSGQESELTPPSPGPASGPAALLPMMLL